MPRMFVLTLLLALGATRPARAEPPDDGDLPQLGSPYAPMVRTHFYARLAKSPWRALGYELLAPGAGNYYVGLHAPAVATLGASLLGASLSIAGALRDQPAVLWSGIAILGAGRGYGLVSAPLGAALLNAAFRQQLGVIASY